MNFLIWAFFLFSCIAKAELKYLNTYEENKSEFIKIAGLHLLPAWPLKSNQNLTTDLALYKNNSDQLIVFSSGLHGIEGFVGSALQRQLMQNLKEKSDVLMIHSLNPWGMNHLRRVNADNIDLNRNFSVDQKLYENKNDDYLKINSFLNPAEKLELGFGHKFFFIFQSVKLILNYGMESLRKSILIGQYSEKNGLYFGGQIQSELQPHVDELFQTTLSKYKKVIWIDLHTGYGARGQLHILANDSKSASGQRISNLFKNQKVDFGDQKNFYKSTGDLCDYLNSKSTSQTEITAVVFEYGTMDSQKTLGSIESLRRMVIENQGFHQGYSDAESKIKNNEMFRDMFFPQEQAWKDSVLKQTENIIEKLK